MFKDKLNAAGVAVLARLNAALDEIADAPECEALTDNPVLDAMRYAVRGGKRLRGFLVLESARLHGIGPEAAMPAAAAVEALHAYSLIHDDLPCMDDDALRRGLPTVHLQWDEATAVLAGDGLQALAFGLCSDPALGEPSRRIELVAALAKAAGARGMVLGQTLDILAEGATAVGRPLGLAEITRLQEKKTGALFGFAAEAGAIIAGADRLPMRRYAAALGLAFQIADDLLDVEGDGGKAGKRVGKDAEAGKATFVSLLGLAEARARAGELVEAACAALAPYGKEAENLKAAAHFAIAREA